MARFNEILSARLNNALKKMLSMKGPAPAPQLSGELMPVLPMFYGQELRFLEEWSLFGVFINSPGAAAILNTVKFRNPVGSNVVAIFTKIAVTTDNAGTIQIDLQQGTDQTDGATPQGLLNSNMDLRTRPQPTLIGSSSGAAAPPSMSGRARTLITTNQTYDFILDAYGQEVPLLPGGSIQTVNNSANTNQFSTWWWRERALEPSELR